jgi:hypothetical protein
MEYTDIDILLLIFYFSINNKIIIGTSSSFIGYAYASISQRRTSLIYTYCSKRNSNLAFILAINYLIIDYIIFLLGQRD